MSLKVIGAGFGRTGTLSLKTALEQLGFGKCHHMEEVIPDRRQVKFWHDISQGKDVDWGEVFQGFESCVDWPSSTFFVELHQRYPDSKVILTIRDPERWYESTAETIYPSSIEIPAWLQWPIPHVRKMVEMVNGLIWNGTFDGRFEEREHAINVFQKNIDRAKKVIPPDKLLVFQATDGWEPLCTFLDVPVPQGPYPHVNEAAKLKRMVRIIRIVRWVPHTLALLVLLWLLL